VRVGLPSVSIQMTLMTFSNGREIQSEFSPQVEISWALRKGLREGAKGPGFESIAEFWTLLSIFGITLWIRYLVYIYLHLVFRLTHHS